MAQNEVNQYDEIDANNVDITGTTVVQAQMYPYHVPIAFRKLMGALKRTFRSDLFRLRDSTDQTKLLSIDLAAITPATTRTWSAPNYGGTVSLQAKGVNIASAATTDIWAATGDYIHITGTTTITSFGATSTAGWERTVIFDGALTLTHNATSLILPGGASIVTAAGDRAIVRSEGGANSIVVAYIRGSASVTPGWERINYIASSLNQTQLGIDVTGFSKIRISGLVRAVAGASPVFSGQLSTNGGSSFLTSYVVSNRDQNAATQSVNRVTRTAAFINTAEGFATDSGVYSRFDIEVDGLNNNATGCFIFSEFYYYAITSAVWFTSSAKTVSGVNGIYNYFRLFNDSGNFDLRNIIIEGVRPQ